MAAKHEWRKNRVVWFEIPASDLARATKFCDSGTEPQALTLALSRFAGEGTPAERAAQSCPLYREAGEG